MMDERLDAVPDDVVIAGVGGLFPKAENIEEFRKRLFENEVLLESRWPDEKNVCNLIGCVNSDDFDNSYFGIHRQQCFFMDPMHRLSLERTFEALVDAGVNPTELRGKRIGVFMGSTIGENDQLFMESVVSGFGVTGHSRAMLANRISYWLNLKGPSVAYDANWISGIEVLRLAFYAIKTGQCDSVIIGTTNLAHHSEFQHMYNDLGMISQDGNTKAFDADASGYGRSEGVVVMYIQRSSEARRIYASVVNVATKFDGTIPGNFLDVDSKTMTEFLDEFYLKCKVKPEEIDFVEANGCGLKKVDKAEIDTFEKIYCKNRTKPLMVGTVKPNTGHAEPSAAFFSIVKTIIAMETDTIPATLQFNKPNPEIAALHNGKVEIVTTNKKWEPKYAAVNALGTSNLFGHVVLEANPKKKKHIPLTLPPLLIASTRTEEGINKILETLKNKPRDPEFYRLVHEVFSRSVQGHLYRGYLLLGDGETKQEIINHTANKRPVWFVYSGMGSQWNGMLGDLMKIELFAESIKRSSDILAKKGVDLMTILSSSEKTIFDNILNCFVGIAAMQIALTDLLRALGIVPDGIIGHSVGELGCAYADGCMTAEQMIMSSYSRGRASLEATLVKGMMAAVGLGYNQIKHRLPSTIEVACHNGPDSCTISGPVDDMEDFVQSLTNEGIFAKLVNVADIAYHSRYIKPAAPLLLKYLKEVLPKPMARSSKWITTSNLEANWDTDLARHSSAEYHTNNLLSSVLFEEGIKHIPKDCVLIEIAPHGLLQAILKRSVKDCISIPLTQRGTKSGSEFLLQGLGKLYLSGVDMKLHNIYPHIEYPVSRNTASLADLVQWNHSDRWNRTEESQKSVLGVKDFDVSLNNDEFSVCTGHKLLDNVVLPLSTYLNIVLQIADNAFGAHGQTFENICLKRDLVIPPVGFVPINAMIQHGTGEFEIFSGEDLVMSGRLSLIDDKEDLQLEEIQVPLSKQSVQISGNDIYSEFKHRGHKYDENFSTLRNLTLDTKGSVATVEYTNQWSQLIEAMLQQHLFNAGERNQEIHVPRYIQKISLCLSALPSTRSDVRINYEYSSGVISAPGIEIQSVKTAPFQVPSQNVLLNSVQSLTLEGNILDNIEAGIERALQLTVSNFGDSTDRKVYITELETKNTLQMNLRNVLALNSMNVNSSLVKETKHITMVESFPQLIIVNDLIRNDVLSLLANSDNAFLLTKIDPTQRLDVKISIVARFRYGSDHYVICRKAATVKPIVITIKETSLCLKDLSKQSASWVKELLTKSKEVADVRTPILLVTSVVPTEGFHSFLQGLRDVRNLENLRIFYNLDQASNKVDEAYRKNLALIILKDNQWLTYLPLSVTQDCVVEKTPKTPIINNQTINYIGLNLRDETLTPEIRNRNEIGNIDYCGVTKTGQRVLGLAYLDKETSKLVVDDVFTWEVPKNWNLDDAVTIPHAYVSAYYMLVVKAGIKQGETVLIHAGCSPIGLAALSICFSYGCQVFTTVSSNKQKAYLKRLLPFMQERNILETYSEKFEAEIMFATGGKGVEIVLNCLSGRLLKSSVSCMAGYGRFIQYGKYDVEQGNSIGMSVFLKNVSFYHVDLQNVFHQEKEVKQEIRKLIAEGFQKYVVRPLLMEVLSNKDMAAVMKKLESPETIGKIVIDASNNLNINELNVKEHTRFTCEPKNSYLIYGGSATNWISIAEWLVHRGARKIVVSTDSKPLQNHLNRRLSLLETYFGANIVMASSKIQSKQTANQLVSEVNNLGPLHVLLTLPSEGNSNEQEVVELLDSALRSVAPEASLVNLINTATGICYKRATSGFATSNVQFTEREEMADVISSLDFILYSELKNVIVAKQMGGSSVKDAARAVIKDLTKLIPSMDDIIQLQKHAPSEPELVQVVSEGPIEIRELSPVFIIPGLTGYAQLADFVKHILYPTFCAVLPRTPWPLEKLAEIYAQRIYETYPRGVFNIVSVSSGGALAIEIAKILSRRNFSLHLYFIDSTPLRIQQGLQDLGDNSLQVEVNILRTVFEINDLELVKELKGCPSFEARIKRLVQRLDKSDKHKELLERGLVVVEDFIEQLKAFKPTNELASGRVHLLIPDDCNAFENYGLISHFKNAPTVIKIDGDHLSIINQKDTYEYFNRNHYQI